MQRAYAKVIAEYPGTKKVQVYPSDSSLLTKLAMSKRAYAVTNPFTGNIAYNRDTMADQSQQDMEQTMAHELAHVRQMQDTPWYGHLAEVGNQMLQNVKSLWGGNEDKVPEGIRPSSPYNDPYYWRPREQEAFQVEKDRALKMGLSGPDPMDYSRDIQLPGPPRRPMVNTGPSDEVLRRQQALQAVRGY